MKAASPGQRLKQQGFEVFTTAEAAKQADIIMILINDEKQAAMYKKDIEPNLEVWRYADVRSRLQHSLRLHQAAEADIDVTMIAPKAPGHTVRFGISGWQGYSVPGCC